MQTTNKNLMNKNKGLPIMETLYFLWSGRSLKNMPTILAFLSIIIFAC